MTSADDLAQFPDLASLRPAELDTLARAGREVTYPAGQRLITEGQPANHCWLLRSGRIVLDAQVPGRADVVVQTLGPGDLLGWSWLVPPYRWHFGARTTEPVDAIEFDSATLIQLADADPQFDHALTRMLFAALLERLQATRARLLDLYGNPAEPCAGFAADRDCR